MFLDTLSTALSKNDRVSEIAMVCYLDLCRAASFIPASYDNVAIRGLEIHEDLKVGACLRDPLVKTQILSRIA